MFNDLSVAKTVSGSLFLLLNGACFTNTAPAVCYRTPTDAIAADRDISSRTISERGGYRVTKIQSDPVLNQSWAMIVPCDHPGWPAAWFPLRRSVLSTQLEVQEDATKISVPVVHAGDIVRLWRQENFIRIEVAGISERNGGLGDLIRVRLLRRNTDDQSVAEQFSGIVRGPFDVEMMKP